MVAVDCAEAGCYSIGCRDGVADVAIDAGEVRMVEDVEGLDAQLEGYMLSNFCGLGQGHIPLIHPWAQQRANARATELANGGCIGGGGEPLGRCLRHGDRGDLVRARGLVSVDVVDA